jgi:hypothetical protein
MKQHEKNGHCKQKNVAVNIEMLANTKMIT